VDVEDTQVRVIQVVPVTQVPVVMLALHLRDYAKRSPVVMPVLVVMPVAEALVVLREVLVIKATLDSIIILVVVVGKEVTRLVMEAQVVTVVVPVCMVTREEVLLILIYTVTEAQGAAEQVHVITGPLAVRIAQDFMHLTPSTT